MYDNDFNKPTGQEPQDKKILEYKQSEELFKKLTLNHRHTLSSMNASKIDGVKVLEESFLQRFVDNKEKDIVVERDFYHQFYSLRAITQFHGLETYDTTNETKIFTRTPLQPPAKLWEFLEERRKKKNEQNNEL